MINFFNKKGKYENCLYTLFTLITSIYGLYIYFNTSLRGIRIFNNTLGLILTIVSILLLIAEILILCVFKNQKIKRILYLITIVIFLLVVIDCLILGIVRTFIIAANSTLEEISTLALHYRLAYICINKYPMILMGVWTTIWISLAGTAIGLILALMFIVLRTQEITPKDNEFTAFLKKIAIGFVKIYVTIFRGTPMMVQAIIIYYFLPLIIVNFFGVNQQTVNEILSATRVGLITVSLNTTAYLVEVLRGGIESLNKGQMEAARSLGMTRTQAMTHVILPQGIKNSLPAICNEFIINIKDTSVLNVVSVIDLFYVVGMINGKGGTGDAYFIAAIIYLCLTLGISKLLGLLEKRMNLVSKPLPSSN